MNIQFHIPSSYITLRNSLDGIPVPIQHQHQMVAVRSELQLEVLLLVVEEERLHHLEC